MTNENDNLVSIYMGSHIQAEIIRGLLEANEIPSMLKDESFAGVYSLQGTIGNSFKVLVRPQDEEAAKSLLEDVPMDDIKQ